MDNIGNSISKGIAKINLKTTNMMEENKLKTYISTLRNEIAALQSKIGSELYAQWKDGAVNMEALEADLQKIQENENLIEEQQKKIDDLLAEEKRILGSNQAADQVAGAGQTAGAPVRRFCPNCGCETVPQNKFCVKCGTPLT